MLELFLSKNESQHGTPLNHFMDKNITLFSHLNFFIIIIINVTVVFKKVWNYMNVNK